MTFPPGETPLVIITIRCTTQEALAEATAQGGELVGDLLARPGIDDARIRKAIDGVRPARPKPAGPVSSAAPACPAPTCPIRPKKESL